jgi:hypothetical protein
MFNEAAEHHKKAAEHYEFAAHHHKEAVKLYHEAGFMKKPCIILALRGNIMLMPRIMPRKAHLGEMPLWES